MAQIPVKIEPEQEVESDNVSTSDVDNIHLPVFSEKLEFSEIVKKEEPIGLHNLSDSQDLLGTEEDPLFIPKPKSSPEAIEKFNTCESDRKRCSEQKVLTFTINLNSGPCTSHADDSIDSLASKKSKRRRVLPDDKEPTTSCADTCEAHHVGDVMKMNSVALLQENTTSKNVASGQNIRTSKRLVQRHQHMNHTKQASHFGRKTETNRMTESQSGMTNSLQCSMIKKVVCAICSISFDPVGTSHSQCWKHSTCSFRGKFKISSCIVCRQLLASAEAGTDTARKDIESLRAWSRKFSKLGERDQCLEDHWFYKTEKARVNTAFTKCLSRSYSESKDSGSKKCASSSPLILSPQKINSSSSDPSAPTSLPKKHISVMRKKNQLVVNTCPSRSNEFQMDSGAMSCASTQANINAAEVNHLYVEKPDTLTSSEADPISNTSKSKPDTLTSSEADPISNTSKSIASPSDVLCSNSFPTANKAVFTAASHPSQSLDPLLQSTIISFMDNYMQKFALGQNKVRDPLDTTANCNSHTQSIMDSKFSYDMTGNIIYVDDDQPEDIDYVGAQVQESMDFNQSLSNTMPEESFPDSNCGSSTSYHRLSDDSLHPILTDDSLTAHATTTQMDSDPLGISQSKQTNQDHITFHCQASHILPSDAIPADLGDWRTLPSGAQLTKNGGVIFGDGNFLGPETVKVSIRNGIPGYSFRLADVSHFSSALVTPRVAFERLKEAITDSDLRFQVRDIPSASWSKCFSLDSSNLVILSRLMSRFTTQFRKEFQSSFRIKLEECSSVLQVELVNCSFIAEGEDFLKVFNTWRLPTNVASTQLDQSFPNLPLKLLEDELRARKHLIDVMNIISVLDALRARNVSDSEGVTLFASLAKLCFSVLQQAVERFFRYKLILRKTILHLANNNNPHVIKLKCSNPFCELLFPKKDIDMLKDIAFAQSRPLAYLLCVKHPQHSHSPESNSTVKANSRYRHCQPHSTFTPVVSSRGKNTQKQLTSLAPSGRQTQQRGYDHQEITLS